MHSSLSGIFALENANESNEIAFFVAQMAMD